MWVKAAAVSVLAHSADAAEPWGSWCDETGLDRITLATHGVFPGVQTACPVAFPANGDFAGELACVTTLFMEDQPPQHLDVLIDLETRLTEEGLVLRIGDGSASLLQPCDEVWN